MYGSKKILTAGSRLLLTLGISVVAVKWYMQAFYNPEFSKFPEPVANTLRRAIYHTNIKPDPELALKYYKKAMQQCAELGLDPFSDEVLGIRIQVSFWLQKIGSHRAAVDVLESILTDCKKWVSIMDLSVKEGKVTADGRYAADEQAKLTKEAAVDPNNKQTAEKSTTATKQDGPEQEPENLWRKRQRLLAKAVGTSVKLGELYSSDHVLEAEKSEPHLVWAVETALSEFKRRKTDGIKPGEQDWLSAEELGGSMESLGRDYERRSQFHLAIPLFFQALRLCKDPCHRVVIMNNLAASFAQYPAGGDSSAARLSESLQHLTDSAMPQTRKDCLEAGENWAKNALAHSKDVKGDERTPECDAGCAVALCNWADVAAMMGKRAVAKTKYLECIEMSSKIGFSQGIEQAREGLARLGEA